MESEDFRQPKYNNTKCKSAYFIQAYTAPRARYTRTSIQFMQNMWS